MPWHGWSLGPGLESQVEGIRAGRKILQRVHPCRLVRFEDMLRGRSITAPEWFPSLWAVKPRHVRRLAALSGDLEATAVVLAAHPSGWVRHATLELLEKCATPLALGMLVLRANDWVEPIRMEAQARLRAVAAVDQRPVFVLPAVEQLARSDSRSAGFARDLLRLVSDNLSVSTLVAALTDATLSVRRTAARLLVGKGLPEGALDVALRQDDAVTAWIVVEEAARQDTSESLSRLLLAAPSPRLRRLGLLRLLQLGRGDTATDAARAALLDPHVHVRSEAQAFLIDGDVDPRVIYAGWLESRPAVAVLGLAETGSADDASLVLAHGSHASTRVREAVCLALSKLAPQAYRRALLAFARDPSPRVARRAVDAIVGSHATPLELDELWSLVTTDTARRAVLRAFDSLGRWVQLTYAFRSIASGVARAEGMVLLGGVLARWNASFTAPSPERGRELASLLPKVLRRLEPRTARQLDFTIGTHLGRPAR